MTNSSHIYSGSSKVRTGDLFSLISKMKELNSKAIGVITEEEIKLWFLKQGLTVSVPIGDNARYDFIVDFNNKLVRFQSKTSNLTRTENCLNFACASIKYNSQGSNRTKYSQDEIDYFITLHPKTRQIYIVPVEECGNECNLRFVPPKSNNYNGVKMAKDYEGDKIVERIFNS